MSDRYRGDFFKRSVIDKFRKLFKEYRNVARCLKFPRKNNNKIEDVIDNLENIFNSLHHLKEWVEKDRSIKNNEAKKIFRQKLHKLQDGSFSIIRELSNRGKHFPPNGYKTELREPAGLLSVPELLVDGENIMVHIENVMMVYLEYFNTVYAISVLPESEVK